MGVNSGIWSAINASISHNQRVNRSDETTGSSMSGSTKSMTNYNPISSPKEILEELKFILEEDRNKDENSIAIYDVINLVRAKRNECKSSDSNLYHRISALTGLDYLFLEIDYDSENRYLIVSYHCKEMFFTKKDDDLVLVKSEYYKAKDILGKCGKEISERYDKFIQDISFYRDYMNNVQSTNSNFKINSDEDSIDIKYNNSFKLSAMTYENEYQYDCNSNNITSVCRDKEDEIFKRIFIKIDDCPEWTHEKLYAIRKEQLEEQEKLEYKEMKKQKRLELVRRLNPFRKK